MNRLPITHLILFGILALVLAACADTPAAVGGAPSPGESDVPTATDTPIPVEPDGGIGDTPVTPDDTPIPVEPDGGIGDSSAPADTPIPVEPDGGIGDGSGPSGEPAEAPDFGISSETDSLAAAPTSSCWTVDGTGICKDGIPMPTAHPISADDQLVVTFAEGTLTASAMAYEGEPTDEPPSTPEQDVPVTVENPGVYLVDVSGLASGDHWLTLAWNGEQGDAFVTIALTVTA